LLERLEGPGDVLLRNGAATRAKKAAVGVEVAVVVGVEATTLSTDVDFESDDAASALAAALLGETAERLLPPPPPPARGKPEPSPELLSSLSSRESVVARRRKLENILDGGDRNPNFDGRRLLLLSLSHVLFPFFSRIDFSRTR